MITHLQLSIMLTASAMLFCTGCSTWFFQPSKLDYTAGWKQRGEYLKTNDFFLSPSGNRLNYWVFPPKKSSTPKAIVLQFHGNAQNISSHFASLGWLADFNFEFITFDYSGYGKSGGKANMQTVLKDTSAAIDFAANLATQKKVPLIIYGQSLGGALLLKTLKDKSPFVSPCAVFIESSFPSLPKMAQTVAGKFWLFWPIQWIPRLTVSSAYNPIGKNINKLDEIPKYILHAKEDPVVPFSQGESLFKHLSGQKIFWEYDRGHISFWMKSDRQQKLVKELDALSNTCKVMNSTQQ